MTVDIREMRSKRRSGEEEEAKEVDEVEKHGVETAGSEVGFHLGRDFKYFLRIGGGRGVSRGTLRKSGK